MSRTLYYLLFISIALLILVGSHVYFYRRLVRDPAWPVPWIQVGKWLLVVMAASVPLVFPLGRVLPHSVARFVLFLPYVWMGMMVLLFFFLLSTDLLKALAWLGLKVTGHGDFFAETARRVLRARIVAGAILCTTLVLTIVAVITAALPPKVRRIRVEVARWPEALNGFTIAQLTDLHLGPTLNQAFLEDVVARTNSEKPDLVAITGDVVDASVERLLPALQSLKQLEAPHGVFLVTGNHEYYAGPEEWLPALEGLDIRVLRNERVAIEQDGATFDLAGIHDPQGYRFSPEYAPDLGAALAGRDANRAVVLLAHQSLVIDEAEAAGVGLVLSGHNHGGQIWPWMHAVGLQQPYVVGLHRQGDTAIYVGEGTGFWGPPMRLGTRSEIALIEVHAKQSKEEP